ncbi:MAG: putative porin [Flavobacteriaceae bacterium]|nr:putative porin [Flavobacteriaceae bacterium]MDG1962499.1 putative porin [Flavobacteriaceae bacterium]
MMKKTLVLLFWGLSLMTAFSQDSGSFQEGFKPPEREKPGIDLYQIISLDGDTTIVDTTLSLEKLSRFNYLRKDDLTLLTFSNVGQAYNALTFTPGHDQLTPLFAAQAQHINYQTAEEINYYRVPTPLTELYFKTAFEQGQQLDAFFTVNTSERLNISLAYKGVRSLGQFQHILNSTGNFRATLSYDSDNGQYHLKGHLTAQDILNQQNGGLTENALVLYQNNDPEFNDRGRLDVRFEDAENQLRGTRYFVNQEYQFGGGVAPEDDSAKKNWGYVGMTNSFETKSYQYKQDQAFEDFGDAYVNEDLKTKTKGIFASSELYTGLKIKGIKKLEPFVGHHYYRYGYNRLLDLSDGVIQDQIKEHFYTAGVRWEGQWNKWGLEGQFKKSISAIVPGSLIEVSASRNLGRDSELTARYLRSETPAALNMQLNQSDYQGYNWQNSWGAVRTQTIEGQLNSDFLGRLKAQWTKIDGYVYFGNIGAGQSPVPMQDNNGIALLALRHDKIFNFGKFGYESNVIYQNVLSGTQVMPLPELLARQSLYFQDEWFQKAALIQTGFRAKYFTPYFVKGYDPVLAEFYVQNEQEIGGFPLIDFFFQAKIRQTRFFLVYEHLNQMFTSVRDQFSAPGYPYRDALVRFGLVWNFFQ